MRSRLPRLAGLATAAALVLSPLAAAPANAAPGGGTITVTIVDDLGKPVTGVVMLVPESVDEDSNSAPIYLGEDEDAVKSSYSELVPAGKYGIITMGGWSLVTCAGLKSCSFLSGDAPEIDGNGAFTVTEGGATTYTVTTPAPKLSGAGKVGAPLFVDTPALPDDELGMLMGGLSELSFLYGDLSEPSVTWKRDGVAIRNAREAEYTPTGSDAGSTISAEVRFPAIFRLFAASGSGGPFGAPGVLPGTATLGPVMVTKNESTTDVRVVGQRRVGQSPSAWFTVRGGGDSLNGWLTVTGADNKPLRLRLRDGFAKVELRHLRAGKHTITASFAGSSTLNPSSDTATFKMKKAKKHKLTNKNKKR